MSRRRFVLGAGAVTLAAFAPAQAQGLFRLRPLIFMAPVNPGGAADLVARLMQAAITQEQLTRRPVEVINRGGAGATIALAELAARHRGDPNIIMPVGSSAISAALRQNSPVQLTDTEPIARLVLEHLVVAVPPTSPFRNIQQLLTAFRSEPEAFSWCGGSAGSADHLLVGLIAEACNVPISQLRYIAYAGGGAASAAVLGGQVSAGIQGYSEWRGFAETGQMRLLAITSHERTGDKAIPTLRESGVDVVFEDWRGVLAPPGLKPEQVHWWAELIDRMHASPTWQGYLARNGWQDGYLQREEFRQRIRLDEERYARLLERLGMGGSSSQSAAIGPYAVPAVIGVTGAAAVAAVVAEHLRASVKPVAAAGAEDDADGGGPPPAWSRFLTGAVLSLAYIGALSVAGFLIATPLAVFAICRVMDAGKPLQCALSGAGLALVVWLLFTRLLNLELPQGALLH